MPRPRPRRVPRPPRPRVGPRPLPRWLPGSWRGGLGGGCTASVKSLTTSSKACQLVAPRILASHSSWKRVSFGADGDAGDGTGLAGVAGLAEVLEECWVPGGEGGGQVRRESGQGGEARETCPDCGRVSEKVSTCLGAGSALWCVAVNPPSAAAAGAEARAGACWRVASAAAPSLWVRGAADGGAASAAGAAAGRGWAAAGGLVDVPAQEGTPQELLQERSVANGLS